MDGGGGEGGLLKRDREIIGTEEFIRRVNSARDREATAHWGLCREKSESTQQERKSLRIGWVSQPESAVGSLIPRLEAGKGWEQSMNSTNNPCDINSFPR